MVEKIGWVVRVVVVMVEVDDGLVLLTVLSVASEPLSVDMV